MPVSVEFAPASNWVDVLAQLAAMPSISLAELRGRLLPLDLLANAVIEDLNQRSLDLTGELALEAVGDRLEIHQTELAQVVETWLHS